MKKRVIPFILMLSLILSSACSTHTVATNAESGAQTDEDTTWEVAVHPSEARHSEEREYARRMATILVQIDGEKIAFGDQRPAMVDGRTLVPVRGVLEHVGFDVDWNPVSGQVTLTSDDYEVILTIDSANFITNGITHTLDVPAQIMEGRTMLPIRAVMESVGYYVGWDDGNRTVLISSTPMTYITIRGERFNTAITTLAPDFDRMTNEEFALVAELTNLTRLFIGESLISDLAPISGLTNLEQLSVRGAIAGDLTPVSGLTNLTWLSIFGYHINDITPIANLTNLTHLDISDTRVNDISPISNLNGLTWLNVANSQVSDIMPLANLTSLDSLILANNQISDLGALSGLTSLEHLSLGNNQIVDLSPLANLTNLGSLGLSDNQISDLTPLAHMTGLGSLHLDNNPITDWSPVAHVQWVNGRP